MPNLTLLRHGQSQWNLENRFTGWVDVDITAQGEAEARRAGELFRAEGLLFDRAFSSLQTARFLRAGFSARRRQATVPSVRLSFRRQCQAIKRF